MNEHSLINSAVFVYLFKYIQLEVQALSGIDYLQFVAIY